MEFYLISQQDDPIFDDMPTVNTLELDSSCPLIRIDLCSNSTSSHLL
jgi:hypothetical protein